jgi:general secretion pathway protein E
VNLLIARAVEARASDIHIEPMEGELVVRYRIDGVLHDMEPPPAQLAAAIVSRVKIMASLNIAERRLAQDGRIRFAVRGKEVEFRVSTISTVHGESVVLRILDRSNLKLDFESLGFDEEAVRAIRDLIGRPYGILLATGPTGSGKTTTLYTGLLELNTRQRKILTIEDPAEYQLKGINQVQVKPQIGVTFASALRSFLRQDPDVMMVGEIRDLETAQVAVQAALTGHVILSTLHTNDAASAITRLLDMGVEDFLLTSTLNGVVAQRLVRTLCRHCRESYEVLPELAEKMEIAPRPDGRPHILCRARGCEHCGGTGYFGRSSIVEVLTMNDAIRQLVLSRADNVAIRRQAIASGMRSMHRHGMKKVLAGDTSVEEVLRATRLI